MPDNPDQYVLSDIQHKGIFRDLIVPNELAGPSQTAPVVLLLAGQTGAGKSHTKAALTTALGLDEAVGFGSDTLRNYHPQYQRLLREDDRITAFYTDRDARK